MKNSESASTSLTKTDVDNSTTSQISRLNTGNPPRHSELDVPALSETFFGSENLPKILLFALIGYLQEPFLSSQITTMVMHSTIKKAVAFGIPKEEVEDVVAKLLLYNRKTVGFMSDFMG